MGTSLLEKIFRRPSGSFMRAARKRKLRRRVARILEPGALEIAPMEPECVLESRELFEMVAMRSVLEDARNLALSFALVDSIASSIETLGLAESNAELDPFRRVWVESSAGVRERGVIFTCRGGEVAVFCPPGGGSIADVGSALSLSYRGVSSAAEHHLQLDDAVRLPGARVLHLTELDGAPS